MCMKTYPKLLKKKKSADPQTFPLKIITEQVPLKQGARCNSDTLSLPATLESIGD